MPSTSDDILAVCRRHMAPEEAERLVCWLAGRLERSQALAGDRPAIERLDHVVGHWLSEGQRSSLLAWMTRRAALGQPLVPGMPRAEDRSARGLAVDGEHPAVSRAVAALVSPQRGIASRWRFRR